MAAAPAIVRASSLMKYARAERFGISAIGVPVAYGDCAALVTMCGDMIETVYRSAGKGGSAMNHYTYSVADLRLAPVVFPEYRKAIIVPGRITHAWADGMEFPVDRLVRLPSGEIEITGNLELTDYGNRVPAFQFKTAGN